MSSAELNKKKLDLIAWIYGISDENIIEFLETFKFSKSDKDWWDELSGKEKQVLLAGIEDIDKGNTISSEQFWNKMGNE